MIRRGRKMLSLALAASAVSGMTSPNPHLRGRELYSVRQVEFVDDCVKELSSDAVTADRKLSQTEFANTWFVLCTNYDLSEGCDMDASFDNLPDYIQNAFAYDICKDETIHDCLNIVLSLGSFAPDYGYVVSGEEEVYENLVNNLCVELESAVYGDDDGSDGPELSGKDDTTTKTSSSNVNVAGAATLGSAALLLLGLIAGERKQLRENEQKIKSIPGDTSQQTEESPEPESESESGVMLYLNVSGSRDGATAIDKLKEAIDTANWDKVYELASKLAEREDMSTISSIGSHSVNRTTSLKLRRHLSPVDQAHAKSLDRHVSANDWTAVARTASLYAGQLGSGRPSTSKYMSKAAVEASDETSLGNLKDRIDTAVDSGDWDTVLSLSNEVEESGVKELCSLLPDPDLIEEKNRS